MNSSIISYGDDYENRQVQAKLDHIESFALDQISNINSGDEAREFVKNITDFEKLLKASERFREYRIRYTRIETYCYIELQKRGFGSYVPKKYQDYIKYLASLSISELEEKINQDDFTLVSSNNMSTKREKQTKIATDTINGYKCDKIDEYVKDGIVTITTQSLQDAIYDNGGDINPGFAYDAINSLRGTLINLGAVGCGEGLYVNPKSKDKQKLFDAIKIRFKSIQSDIQSLNSLIDCIGEPIDMHTNNSNYGNLYEYDMLILMAMIASDKGNSIQFRTARESVNVLIRLLERFKHVIDAYEPFGEIVQKTIDFIRNQDEQTKEEYYKGTY